MRPQIVQPERAQESVWDYPRPPQWEKSDRHIEVLYGDVLIAETQRAIRVLETSHPPVYYVPPQDGNTTHLIETPGGSLCEWKGLASYYSLRVNNKTVEKAAWSYGNPNPEFTAIRDFIAFYPGKIVCFVDGERVKPQPGGFYGGWITKDIAGPFKGEPGTWGW